MNKYLVYLSEEQLKSLIDKLELYDHERDLYPEDKELLKILEDTLNELV